MTQTKTSVHITPTAQPVVRWARDMRTVFVRSFGVEVYGDPAKVAAWLETAARQIRSAR